MNYENAGAVLPPELLREVQKYAAGTLLYIPAQAENRPWGEKSGYRQALTRRNQVIFNSFRYCESIQQLSEDFHLSEETVRKIVYSKKNAERLVFRPTVRSAEEYRDAGMLAEWAYTYMRFERCHQRFAVSLYRTEQHWFGPTLLPPSLARRNTGPEKSMRWQISREIFERETAYWMRRLTEESDLPPMLIGYESGVFAANCHNPMLEALHRLKTERYPFLVRADGENLPALERDYPEICRV